MTTTPELTSAPTSPHETAVRDQLGRAVRDLRISVTDRCNFRCAYCMPKSVFGKDYRYLPQQAILRFEEIVRMARISMDLGVRKVRLTGGEPLLRKNIEELVAELVSLRGANGQALEVTLTTNGSLLTRKAQALKAAGLARLAVSLDSLDKDGFARMNDVGFQLTEVLQGIETAQHVGFDAININMVVKRGENEDQIVPMAAYCLQRGLILRFIEYMDVGSSNRWCMDQVLTSAQSIALLEKEFTLTPLPHRKPGETAQRFAAHHHKTGHSGELGFISSVSQAFCKDCNRMRLSTDGRLFLCLFASQGHDLRTLLRDPNLSDADILQTLQRIWLQRTDRYSELRAQGLAPTEQRIEMSYIGG